MQKAETPLIVSVIFPFPGVTNTDIQDLRDIYGQGQTRNSPKNTIFVNLKYLIFKIYLTRAQQGVRE